MSKHRMFPSAHSDSFARDHLPPANQQPPFLLDLPEFTYPDRINCAVAFVEQHVREGRGDAPCLISPIETWSYAELDVKVNRIANVLINDLGMVAGNRVLIRSANTPMHVAAVFAVIKAGGIVISTMPMLRAKELAFPLTKAKVSLALCDYRLSEEMAKAVADTPHPVRMVSWGADQELNELMAGSGYELFEAANTAQDDVCLIGFTSGTTGEPKGTMHFHRDMLAICDGYAKQVLKAQPTDRFIGSPPLAFTFGLGGLVLFPLRIGASTILLETAPPDKLLPAIANYGATVCFTAPTAYKAMLARLAEFNISSLRKCISAGEALPIVTFDDWRSATGLELMDGIGSTEMLHIFIAAPEGKIRPGSTGLPVPGYEAAILDEQGSPLPHGTPGRLAVRGPTGCRYLADPRQRKYVAHGWNITGDTYLRDADGYYWYQARSDDMIVSAGYNIAGPEVESCLLVHSAVAECGVVGQPDADRGMIVKAYVVLKQGLTPSAALTKELQDFVKAEIAPYKYPRAISFVESLPRTNTGKLQRFALRQMAEQEGLVSATDSERTML